MCLAIKGTGIFIYSHLFTLNLFNFNITNNRLFIYGHRGTVDTMTIDDSEYDKRTAI